MSGYQPMSFLILTMHKLNPNTLAVCSAIEDTLNKLGITYSQISTIDKERYLSYYAANISLDFNSNHDWSKWVVNSGDLVLDLYQENGELTELVMLITSPLNALLTSNDFALLFSYKPEEVKELMTTLTNIILKE